MSQLVGQLVSQSINPSVSESVNQSVSHILSMCFMLQSSYTCTVLHCYGLLCTYSTVLHTVHYITVPYFTMCISYTVYSTYIYIVHIH